MNENKYPKITFTITTCNRLDLFIKTMDSFLANCMDKDLITRWILSDDHSSAKDLRIMRKKYPFFEIYSSHRKGHPANLNNLFPRVKTEWFFHCEDDWLFIRKGHFIRDMFDVAFTDETIRDVTLRYWTGNPVKKNGVRYNLHQFKPWIYDKAEIAQTNSCWYGYTLNPGLQHTETVRRLGLYNEDFDVNSRFFDRPQAIRYLTYGYKRANLMFEYIKHIGEDNSAYSGD